MELQVILKNSRYVAIGALLLGLTLGCTSFRGGRGSAGDDEATYKVESQAGGFRISSTYSRPALVNDGEAVLSACKKGLIATAHDYAHSYGRTIQPLEEQRIRVRMNRNGTTGMTNCEASVPVVWAR